MQLARTREKNQIENCLKQYFIAQYIGIFSFSACFCCCCCVLCSHPHTEHANSWYVCAVAIFFFFRCIRRMCVCVCSIYIWGGGGWLTKAQRTMKSEQTMLFGACSEFIWIQTAEPILIIAIEQTIFRKRKNSFSISSLFICSKPLFIDTTFFPLVTYPMA